MYKNWIVNPFKLHTTKKGFKALTVAMAFLKKFSEK